MVWKQKRNSVWTNGVYECIHFFVLFKKTWFDLRCKYDDDFLFTILFHPLSGLTSTSHSMWRTPSCPGVDISHSDLMSPESMIKILGWRDRQYQRTGGRWKELGVVTAISVSSLETGRLGLNSSLSHETHWITVVPLWPSLPHRVSGSKGEMGCSRQRNQMNNHFR